MPGNDAYRLDAMPVPAVLVTLKGGAGGLLMDESTGKEVMLLAIKTSRHEPQHSDLLDDPSPNARDVMHDSRGNHIHIRV